MIPKTKNIIIFTAIAAAFILIYIFFIKSPSDTPALVSSGSDPVVALPGDIPIGEGSSSIAQDFLNLLLNVKTIKLNDAIFSDIAFLSLRDSSITLTHDGSEGRPNPFAPLGQDIIVLTPVDEGAGSGTSSGAPAAPTPPSTPKPPTGGTGSGAPAGGTTGLPPPPPPSGGGTTLPPPPPPTP